MSVVQQLKFSAEKACTICRVPKTRSTEHFYTHKVSRDGLDYACKTCRKILAGEKRETKHGKALERRRFSSPEYKEKTARVRATKQHKDKMRRYNKAWREKNLLRKKALTWIHWQKVYGNIVVPEKCERCAASPPLSADFTSDTNPTADLRFLCGLCKGDALRLRRKKARMS